jgi:vancomycin permeability regulator SanA
MTVPKAPPAKAPAPAGSGSPVDPPSRPTGVRRWLRRSARLAVAALVVAAVAAGPAIWLRVGASGHLYTVDNAPTAQIVIVFGAELAPGGVEPKPFLAGRLAVTAELVRTGKARAVLVSGDGNGTSGNEVAAMTSYLVAHGVPARRIVGDPHGLDSYDTCLRAYDVYGVRRALLVTQSYHLPRAVALCRRLGVNADGVAATCSGCNSTTLMKNTARELPAAWKATYDSLSGRTPAVSSPHDDALTEALEG